MHTFVKKKKEQILTYTELKLSDLFICFKTVPQEMENNEKQLEVPLAKVALNSPQTLESSYEPKTTELTAVPACHHHQHS